MISKLTGTLVFACLQEPVTCYDKEKGKEWKVGIVVDEDTADEWDKIYKKQPAKAIKTGDFEEAYKREKNYLKSQKDALFALKGELKFQFIKING